MSYFLDYLNARKKYLNAAFVNIALAGNWSTDIVKKISVDIQEGAPTLKIPGELKAQVTDLEYGKPGQPATYVLRKFKDVVNSVVADATVNAIYHSLSPNSAPDPNQVEK